MNILMVSPNVVVGGAQKIMLYLAKGLEQRGHRVFIYTTYVDLSKLPPFTKNLRYIVNNVNILRQGGELSNYTAIDNVGILAFRLIQLRRELVKIIKKYRIDLVNPHNPPANWICSFLRVPVVWSTHNNPMSLYQNIRRGYIPLSSSKGRFYHRAIELLYEPIDYLMVRFGIHHIISISEKISRGVYQVYGRTSDVIPFALTDEEERMCREEVSLEKFTSLNGRPLIVIQVGQLTVNKNPMCSIDAIELVSRQIPKIKFYFVGDGILRQPLEDEVSRRGLEDKIKFLGHQSETELRQIYRSAHILLFPGEHGPFPIAPMEAIVGGVVPIIAENVGIREVVEKSGLGFFVKPSAEEFARKILYIREHASEVQHKLARARTYIAEELSYRSFIDKYERCFQEHVHQRGFSRS